MNPEDTSNDNKYKQSTPGTWFWWTVRRGLMGLIAAGMIFWGILAVFWSNLPAGVRPVAAGLFGVGSLALLLFVRPRRRGLLVFLTVFALLVIWWLRIPPSNT